MSPIDQFINKGLTCIAAPQGMAGLIRIVLAGLPVFMAESDRYKRRCGFDYPYRLGNKAKEKDKDTAYIVKWGERNHDGTRSDKKQMWHHRHGIMTQLLDTAGVDYSRHMPFLEACEQLHELCWETTRDLLRKIDQKKGSNLVARFEAMPRHAHLVRFICYMAPRDESELILAQPHIDRNSGTFALYESCSGLEAKVSIRNGRPARWRPVASTAKKLL